MKNKVYEMVTNRIIEQLENGITANNWECPFSGLITGAYKKKKKKPYSLLNQMLLKNDGEYATLKQWNSQGGKIRKGEKGELVVFWKIYEVETVSEDGTKGIENIPLLRYYYVFHISQVEGVKPLDIKPREFQPIEEAERILTNYIEKEQITLEFSKSSEAYYSPNRDLIHLPLREQFKSESQYYATAYHEAIHSSGHIKRLNRLNTSEIASFGSASYSKEEMCAELGSAMILNRLGIETPKTFKNSTAYIHSWIQVLKNDPRFIVSASTKAEKAVKYIFNEA